MSTISEELRKLREAGSGNPNYVETIDSTLDDVFAGRSDISELFNSALHNSATIRIHIEGNNQETEGLRANAILYPQLNDDYAGVDAFQIQALDLPDVTSCKGAFAVVSAETGELVIAQILFVTSGQASSFDIKPTATLFDTTLTIIHHPLPGSGA